MAKEKTTTRTRQGASLEGEAHSGGVSGGSESPEAQSDKAGGGGTPASGTQRDGYWQAVTIDTRTIHVNYGSKEEFAKLLAECSLRAYTDISKPKDPRRKFFQCIHCGDKSFTNKMRLNKHRWDSQCPAVQDEMGNPARLLPYPDQGRGQGKLSEMIRKGKGEGIEAKLMHASRGKEVEGGAQRIRSRSANSEGERLPQLEKAVEDSTHVAPKGMKRTAVLREEDENAKGVKQSELVTEQEEEKTVIRSGQASKPKKKAVRQREGSPTHDLREGDVEQTNSDGSAQGYRVRTRSNFERRASTKAGGGSVLVSDAFTTPDTVPEDSATLPLTVHEHIRRNVEQAAMAKVSPSSAGDPPGANKYGLRTKAAQSAVEKLYTLQKRAGGRHVQESPAPKRAKAAGSPGVRRNNTRVIESDDSTGERLDEQAGHDWSEAQDLSPPNPADVRQTLGQTRGQPLCLTDDQLDAYTEHMDAALEDEAQEIQSLQRTEKRKTRSITPFVTPSRMTAYNCPDKQIVSWTGNYEGHAELQRYWMCGVGVPQPRQYHPELAKCSSGRAERLRRDEREVRMRARVKADELAATWPEIPKPVACDCPDLIQLLRIRPRLLDWNYEGQSAADFKRDFAKSWATEKFQDATRLCSMWWSCEAKEEDYPDVWEAVGRAVFSLCHSVKYSLTPPDVELVANYLQFVKDRESYKGRCEQSAADLRLRQERLVEGSVRLFRRDTEFRREAVLWDWCPLWWVVSQKNVFSKLPPLPWRHDVEEAEEVRRCLIAERVSRQRPPHFVQVLRIALNSVSGRWRQMTCPILGVTDQSVRSMCKSHNDVMRALTLFTYEAPFRFAGMMGWEADVVYSAIMKDAQLVCEGKSERVLDGIMGWVENVRLRALQDLALHHPEVFRTCWMTTVHEHWADQSKVWGKCLRVREDFDIGWVAEEYAPKWAVKVKETRKQILELVHSLDHAFEEDDKAAWDAQLENTELGNQAAEREMSPGKVVSPATLNKHDALIQDPSSRTGTFTVSSIPQPIAVKGSETVDAGSAGLPLPLTPPALVGPLCRQNAQSDEHLDVSRERTRSLKEVYAQILRMAEGASMTENADSDGEPEKQDPVVGIDLQRAQGLQHRKSVTFTPLPILEEASTAWCKLSIQQAYDFFSIDELVEALPRKGNGDIDGSTINFYGGEWDCVPVPLSQLRDLRRTKRFLGQNIVELLSRRLWWSLSASARGEVWVASSFMQGPLRAAWDAGTDDALIKWGKQYLIPSRFYSTCPNNLHVLVPYVSGKHWSLFVFTSTGVRHLDSANMHNEPHDLEYVKRVSRVWELLHERRLKLPAKKANVKCFLQEGNYECGFCALRYMEAFLRIFHGEEPVLDLRKAEATFLNQVASLERGRELQRNVIAAVADELGTTCISQEYEPPYRVTYAPLDDSSPEVQGSRP